jgi:hypothetical protein
MCAGAPLESRIEKPFRLEHCALGVESYLEGGRSRQTRLAVPAQPDDRRLPPYLGAPIKKTSLQTTHRIAKTEGNPRRYPTLEAFMSSSGSAG